VTLLATDCVCFSPQSALGIVNSVSNLLLATVLRFRLYWTRVDAARRTSFVHVTRQYIATPLTLRQS